MDLLNQSIQLLSIQLNQTSCFQGEFIVGANTLVDDMVSAVATHAKNSPHLLDKIRYVRRAGPDIDDGPNSFAGV
jgi:hypothetical protein